MATYSPRQGTLKELDRRLSNGIDVSLLWDERDNSVMVSVVDIRSGRSFDLEASPDNALERSRTGSPPASASSATGTWALDHHPLQAPRALKIGTPSRPVSAPPGPVPGTGSSARRTW